MIRTLAVKNNLDLVTDLSLNELSQPDICWYWVDFVEPTEHEALELKNHFQFHPLAIEDCLHVLQRPKVDFYEGYSFFVLHALNQKDLAAEEVDFFVNERFLVTYHSNPSNDIDDAWQKILSKEEVAKRGPLYSTYLIIDNLVDQYFPPLYQIEDELNEIEDNTKNKSMQVLMDRLFDTRADLLRLRHTIVPMRDLLYRMLTSNRLEAFQDFRVYFTDVYDHLLKQTEMVESNREITADIRDSHISLNSHRMNTIMMTLTVITTIFMPLTFIAGLYGMNFTYMPELTWRYGYFAVLAVMVLIGLTLFFWFKHKGWFDK